MKKIFPYILILTIIVQLFAPFTVGSGVKNNLEVGVNKAEAADCTILGESFTSPYPNSTQTARPSEVTYNIETTNCIGNNIRLSVRVMGVNDEDGALVTEFHKINSDSISFTVKTGEKYCKEGGCALKFNTFIANPDNNLVAGKGSTESLSFKCDTGQCDNAKTWELITLTGAETEGTTQILNGYQPDPKPSDGFPSCDIMQLSSTFSGCIGIGLYYLFFKPTSLVFGLSGRILDFTLMYSISDTSYRSEFVVNGWGIIRDFCNMFFIFVLLYIAFGTILNLHGVKTKEMIINVVIIGLLINFSLFATQIIIDASNILTRVFYNQNTIKTGTVQKDANGNTILDANGKPVISSELGDFNEIKLSEAIVNKVDPQQLVIQSERVTTIPLKGVKGESEGGITGGSFIIVVLLATIVNVVGTIAFISSAFIFIGRVVMLWLAMILAPLAFFSYIVPALQEIKMIGWKHWWPDTLKMAFVAPVFAFFMYIIVGFMDKGLGIVNASMKDASTATGSLSFLIAIIVPFIFIMVLLMKAKSVAVNMSGEIGTAMSKAGAAVGGAGLALATSGTAMAMRGTVGRLGNKLATSEWAKTHGAVGRGLGNLGKWTGGKSFDVRATKLGGMGAKELGVEGSIGKAKEGGYAKHLSEKVEKRQKRAKELEVGENEELKQNLNKIEMEHQGLLREYSHEIETLDKRIKTARENAADINSKETTDPAKVTAKKAALLAASAMSTATSDDIAKKTAAIAAANAMDTEDPVKVALKKEANDRVAELKEYKKAIKDGKSSFTVTSLTDNTVAPGMSKTIHFTDTGTATGIQKNITRSGKSINQLEDVEIPHAHAEIEKENRNRKWSYAEAKSKWGGRANKEAAHKIRMEAKMDSGEKSH